MILNSLPWKQTDYSVVFEIASKYCILDSFFSTISATPFLLREMLCVAVVYWAERPFYKKKSGFMVLIFECQQLLSVPSTHSLLCQSQIDKKMTGEKMKRRLVWGFFIAWEEAGVWVPAPGLSICPHQRREHLGFLKCPLSELVSCQLPCGWDNHYSFYCVKAKPGQISSCGFECIVL